MLKNIEATVVSNIKIADKIYELVLYSEQADLEHFVPGQFANIDIPRSNELLLKRPISINKVDAVKGIITLVYQVVGKGTSALVDLTNGSQVKAILPVGRGYNLKKSDKIVFLVGGGVGIAPLLSVTQKWADKSYYTYLGYRSDDHVYCLDDFQCECEEVFVSSDDGSVGVKGFVTDTLRESLKKIVPDMILACGPPAMMQALKQAIGDLPCQVSMEERMCCGFGACAVCVCGIDHGEGLEYKKVCVEGPVFDLHEVVL